MKEKESKKGWCGGMAQVVERLPSKCKGLNFPSMERKIKLFILKQGVTVPGSQRSLTRKGSRKE
jgi:hypothetical protein